MYSDPPSRRTSFSLTLRLIPLIVGIILLLQPKCSYAAQAFLGVSVSWGHLKGVEQATGYDVGEMVSNKNPGLALSVTSMDSYFAKSSFGYFIEFDIDSFGFSKAPLDIYGEVYANTYLDGYYFQLAPTVFYEFLKNSPRWSFKMGVGFGISYITADGLVLVEGPSLPTKAIHGQAIGTSFGLLAQLSYKNWLIQAKEYTPHAYINGIDFKLELPTFIIGYRFIY